jgi:hypothetical protein
MAIFLASPNRAYLIGSTVTIDDELTLELGQGASRSGLRSSGIDDIVVHRSDEPLTENP